MRQCEGTQGFKDRPTGFTHAQSRESRAQAMATAAAWWAVVLALFIAKPNVVCIASATSSSKVALAMTVAKRVPAAVELAQ
jgi:hypothetical protein